MVEKGKSTRGCGGKSAGGVRIIAGETKPAGDVRIIPCGGTSSHSSNPSSNATPSVSQPQSSPLPSQYPKSTQPPPSHSQSRAAQQREPPPLNSQSSPTQQLQPHPPHSHSQPPLVQIPQPQPPPVHITEHLPPLAHILEHQLPLHPEQQNFQQMLDDPLARPGREHMPLLSQYPIPDVHTIWFDRDREKLTQVIAGIFRRKFDGPYFNWSVTPIHIQERYFRTFADKYNWDIEITELVKEMFLKIAQKKNERNR